MGGIIVGEHRRMEPRCSTTYRRIRGHRNGCAQARRSSLYNKCGYRVGLDNAVSIEAANDGQRWLALTPFSVRNGGYLNRVNRGIARGEIVLSKLPKFRCVLIQINRREHQTG